MKRVDIVIPLSYDAFAFKIKMLTKPINNLKSPIVNPLRWKTIGGDAKIYSKFENGRLYLYSIGKSRKWETPTAVLGANVRAHSKNSVRVTGKFGSGFLNFAGIIALIVLGLVILLMGISSPIAGFIAFLVFIFRCILARCVARIRFRKGNAMLIKWLQNIHLSNDMGGFERP